MSTISLPRLRAASHRVLALSGRSNHHSTMYYGKDERFQKHTLVHERNLTLSDRLQGLKEERADEKSLLGKMTNWAFDQYYSKYCYKNLASTFPREFYGNPWMRLISVDGIPGSGAKKFAKDLATERELMHKDRPGMYYFFQRHGNYCTARQALSESHANGGVGNFYEEWLNMDWKKLYENPKDWEMACKIMGWSLRNMRVADMDNSIEFLVGMRGVVTHQSYISMRAELHAMGENNMFPDVMYQSFIDQFKHMESRLMDWPVMIYVDIEPEEAYANIQKDDSMSEAEKAFYTLDYLKAYKEGYEDFVLATAEKRQHTLVICDQVGFGGKLCSVGRVSPKKNPLQNHLPQT